MTGVYNREIAGSWFPTGFHGHFRSQTRLEYTVPYRHRAKPSPPKKFLDKTKERSNNHLFSRHDNRNIHSDMGDLETYFGLGLGKRKYVSSSVTTQHTKSTQNLTTWRGNESKGMVSTYRSHFENASSFVNPAHANESEPVHVRGNTTLRRRHFRASSAPPSQRRTASLLAWNEPDESFHSKPGVGSRQQGSQQGSFDRTSHSTSTPFAQSTPGRAASTQNYTVSETVTPLNCTE